MTYTNVKELTLLIPYWKGTFHAVRTPRTEDTVGLSLRRLAANIDTLKVPKLIYSLVNQESRFGRLHGSYDRGQAIA